MDTAVADRTDTELADAYRELRALTQVHIEGWARYLAGLPARGEHYLDVADEHGGHLRGLIRGEGVGWSRGLADGWGHGRVIDEVLTEAVPDVLDIDEAAAALGLTAAGIRYKIAAGLLYPIYAGHRLRLFTTQVEALAPGADRAAVAAWEALHLSLPPAVKPAALSLTVGASPTPLPVAARSLDVRCRRLLGIGHELRWFSYEYPSAASYVVDVVDADGNQVRRVLPAARVPSWVLGHADARGLTHLVAYRPGLG